MHAELLKVFFRFPKQRKILFPLAFKWESLLLVMDFAALFQNFTKGGKVAYISVRPERLSDVKFLNEVLAIQDSGLEGDRYKGKGGKRQVTLIQSEHLPVIASFLGLNNLDPGLLRRNIAVEGINLLALKGKRFYIGKALLEYSGECHPCSRMEQSLGFGGCNERPWRDHSQSD